MTSSTTRYSVQQIKFEFLNYIKEFGGSGKDWSAQLAEGPPAAPDLGDRIWIAKPAVSVKAAQLVLDHLAERLDVRRAEGGEAAEGGHWILMVRASGIGIAPPKAGCQDGAIAK